MTRILVVPDDTTDVYVLVEADEELGFDGACSACAFTVSWGRTRFSDSLADAVAEAEWHLDYQH
jgi:CheY-like chemotaxis protein